MYIVAYMVNITLCTVCCFQTFLPKISMILIVIGRHTVLLCMPCFVACALFLLMVISQEAYLLQQSTNTLRSLLELGDIVNFNHGNAHWVIKLVAKKLVSLLSKMKLDDLHAQCAAKGQVFPC